jgi:UDP-N-acetylmuramoylalanine--D-glutamate ligase
MQTRGQLDLAGKRVIVLGLGVHGGGLGVTRFLVQQGAEVLVTDLKTAEQLAPSLESLRGLPIRYVLGEHRLADLDGAYMLVRNPAVPAESPYLEAARRAGVRIEMEMGLFFALCPAPIIGITGTKGKTTTATLAGAILRQVDAQTVVAGNLRVSALELLPAIAPQTPVVLELSSWQLEGIEAHQQSPHVGVVTNVSPDHLNRYGSFEHYAMAKATIVRWQRGADVAVLNRDNATAAAFAAQGHGNVMWFSRSQPVNGVYLDGSAIVMDWNGRRATLCERSDIMVRGEHNLENVLAASAAAVAWGAPADAVRPGVRSFVGVEHRLELVRELDGVAYYNDTAATAPAATLAALRSFGRPVVLIAGGADKELDFAALGREIAARVDRIVLLEGTATAKLEAAIVAAGGKPASRHFTDLQSAVGEARRLARPGDVVLLSPGCASFGMFNNEFQRGDVFRQTVNELT